MKRGAMLVMLLGVSLGAKADTTYGLSGSVDGFDRTGTLLAQNNGLPDGSYTIEQLMGPGVTGLVQETGIPGRDNQFFPNRAQLLNSDGFAFTDTMDGVDYQVHIFGNTDGSGYSADVSGTDGTDLENVAADFELTGSSNQYARFHTLLLQQDSSTSGLQAFSFRFSAAATAAATPEPGSFALMGTGLLGAAALVRRKARR